MPPSGLLIDLFPADYNHNNGSPGSASPSSTGVGSKQQSPIIAGAVTAIALGAISINKSNNSSHPADASSLQSETIMSSSSSSLFSTSPSKMTHVAPFLEMEDGNDDSEYNEAMLEDIPLDDDDDDQEKEDNSNGNGNSNSNKYNHADNTPASLSEQKSSTLPLQEEKKEENEFYNSKIAWMASKSKSASDQHTKSVHDTMSKGSEYKYSSPTNSSSNFKNGSFKGCGKRTRSHHRVYFPSSIHSSLDESSLLTDNDSSQPKPNNNNQSCIYQSVNHQRYNKTSFVRVRDTIHRSEFTPEERRATWYTFDDLRSFKRERRETARRIDHGLLSLPFSPYEATPATRKQNIEGCNNDDDNNNDDDDACSSSSSSSEGGYVYCSRGCENCTEAIGRIRYRHIADGWRAVLNAQEKHHYQQQKMASMSSAEQNQFRTLASFLSGGSSGSKRSSPRAEASALGFGNNGTNEKASSSPVRTMCCPYELAAAYQARSITSLGIARSRAIGDEREVAKQIRRHKRQTQEKRKKEAAENDRRNKKNATPATKEDQHQDNYIDTNDGACCSNKPPSPVEATTGPKDWICSEGSVDVDADADADRTALGEGPDEETKMMSMHLQ